MAIKYDGPTGGCPDDCTNAAPPAVDFQECVDSVTSEESEIVHIYMTIENGTTGVPLHKPTDWTSKAAWATAVTNSGSGIRKLTVIGDQPEPTQSSRTVSKRRKKLNDSVFVMNADIDDMSNLNYEFIRSLQCGGTKCIWYETIGGYIYGGPNGWTADVTKAAPKLDRGENNFAVGALQFEWKAKWSPPRALLVD